MVGHPLDVHFEHCPAGDAGNHSDVGARAVQVGALLDVQFEVGRQVPLPPGRRVRPRQVAADIGHAGGETDAFIVQGVKVLVFQKAGHGAAADEPPVVPGALLVGEDHDLQWVAGGMAVVRQGLDHLYGAHNAQGAVIFAS